MLESIIMERILKLEEDIKVLTTKFRLDLDEDKSLMNYKIEHANKRICDLENQIKNITGIGDAVKRSVTLLQDSDGRKPYKCPICEGKHYIYIDHHETINSNPTKKQISCFTCEGKGIVWG